MSNHLLRPKVRTKETPSYLASHAKGIAPIGGHLLHTEAHVILMPKAVFCGPQSVKKTYGPVWCVHASQPITLAMG